MIHSALIGAAAGQRALTPLAAVAVAAARGRLPEGNGAPALLAKPALAAGAVALAAAELAGDKWHKAPFRTVPSGTVARAATGAIAGAALAPRAEWQKAALIGAVTAFIASRFGLAARLRAMRRYSQMATGLVEDALVIAATAAVVRAAAR